MPAEPNIAIIMADQLRADALGCYGNEVCRTPNLDALAAGGVVMENCYTPNPICVPARASITTGNYSHRATGTKQNRGLIRDDQPKLAEHFAAAGYRTYACGKLHYVPYAEPDEPRRTHGFGVWDSCESGRMVRQYDPAGQRRGIEDYHDYLADVDWGGYSRSHGVGNNDVRPCPSPLPPEHHVDRWVADRSIARLGEHLREHADDPFLLFCSFPKPHSPYDPPLEYADLYDPREIPSPAGDESLLEEKNPVLQATRVTHGQDTLSPAARQVIKAYYYATITHQDAQVGRVLKALEAGGVADNTIVVYLADHGDLMGDFGAYFKCNFLEGSARVPLVVRGPGLPVGQRRSQLAGLQDVLPTLASLTGCELGQGVHGLDLSAALRDPAAETRELFYSQCHDDPHQAAMVTDGRWKYCYAQWGGLEELYDLHEDPRELKNLARRPDASHRDRLADWRDRLIAEARRWGDDGLLDGGGLVHATLDRDAINAKPVGGMGWRWF
jgi:choline-sulfatase